jgi:hypothetical protein
LNIDFLRYNKLKIKRKIKIFLFFLKFINNLKISNKLIKRNDYLLFKENKETINIFELIYSNSIEINQTNIICILFLFNFFNYVSIFKNLIYIKFFNV